MSESQVGQVFHTEDGKTVYIDPKTHQASVFDGVLSAEQIAQPQSMITGPSGDNDLAFAALAAMMPGLAILNGGFKSGFLVLKKAVDSSQSEIDPLGPQEYYILADDAWLPLSISACDVYAWVKEYKNGHKPDYPGYKKHRITDGQFDWLQLHKDCKLKAWYDQECPAFIALACQDHMKIIKPIAKSDSPEPFIQTLSVSTATESVTTEEREI